MFCTSGVALAISVCVSCRCYVVLFTIRWCGQVFIATCNPVHCLQCWYILTNLYVTMKTALFVFRQLIYVVRLCCDRSLRCCSALLRQIAAMLFGSVAIDRCERVSSSEWLVFSFESYNSETVSRNASFINETWVRLAIECYTGVKLLRPMIVILLNCSECKWPSARISVHICGVRNFFFFNSCTTNPTCVCDWPM